MVEWSADRLTMNIPRFGSRKDRGNELLSTAESLDGSLGLSYRCVTLQVSASPCAVCPSCENAIYASRYLCSLSSLCKII